MLESREPNDAGIIIEFKVQDPSEEKELSDTVNYFILSPSLDQVSVLISCRQLFGVFIQIFLEPGRETLVLWFLGELTDKFCQSQVSYIIFFRLSQAAVLPADATQTAVASGQISSRRYGLGLLAKLPV